MLVVGYLDDIDRLVAHLEASRAQQRRVLVEVEPQRFDVVLLFGGELDDVGLGGLGLGALHVEVGLEVLHGCDGVGHLQFVGCGRGDVHLAGDGRP